MRLLLLPILCFLFSINIRKVNLCNPDRKPSYKESHLKNVDWYYTPYSYWKDHAKQHLVYNGQTINEALGFREYFSPSASSASADDCFTFCKQQKRCKFWNFIKYDRVTTYTGCTTWGCATTDPRYSTVRKCQIFSNINSRYRFDHETETSTSNSNTRYRNFQVFSGTVKSLKRASITEKWQKLVTCDARGAGPAFKKCGYDKTYGMSKMGSRSSGQSRSFTLEFGLEYGWTDAVKTTLKQSSTTGYNWGTTSSQTFNTAQTTSAWVEVEKGEVVSICQPVATVENDYVFRASHYKSVYSDSCP